MSETTRAAYVLRTARGLLAYTEPVDTEEFEDCPRLFFTLRFLNKPLPGWSTDWDALSPLSFLPNTHMAGILVRYCPTGRVWRLTGAVDFTHEDDGYEAVWPD
jgi:hypothetical protein